MGRRKATNKQITVVVARGELHDKEDVLSFELTIKDDEDDQTIKEHVLEQVKVFMSPVTDLTLCNSSKGKKLHPIQHIWREIGKGKLYALCASTCTQVSTSDNTYMPMCALETKKCSVEGPAMSVYEIGNSGPSSEDKSAPVLKMLQEYTSNLTNSFLASPASQETKNRTMNYMECLNMAYMTNDRNELSDIIGLTTGFNHTMMKYLMGWMSELDLAQQLNDCYARLPQSIIQPPTTSAVPVQDTYNDAADDYNTASLQIMECDEDEMTKFITEFTNIPVPDLPFFKTDVDDNILKDYQKPDLTVDEPMTRAQEVYDLGIQLMDPSYLDILCEDGSVIQPLATQPLHPLME